MTVTIQEYCSVLDTQAKLERVNNIINALEDAMLSPDMEFVREGYSFDDGQVKVSTNFKSLNELSKAHAYYMKVADILKRKCEGGQIFTARDMRL